MFLTHRLHTHFTHHHRKYFLGFFGWFACIKTILLFAGMFGSVLFSQYMVHAAWETFCMDNSGSLDVPVAECQTLVDLYNSTDGDHWNDTTNWLTSPTIATRTGITLSLWHVGTIDLSNNNLVGTISLSGLTNIYWLTLNNNTITDIHLTDLPALTSLSLHYNQLSSLDVSALTWLSLLWTSNNHLTGLNLSWLITLGSLDVNTNLISSIDLSVANNLGSVNIAENPLIYINLSGLTHLTALWLYHDLLTSINLSGLYSLVQLDLWYNQLTGIDVTWLTHMDWLYLDGNHISNIDVSFLHDLWSLYLWGNQLTSIDLAGLEHLWYVNLWANNLNSVNLSGCTAMQKLYLQSNNLSSVDITNLTGLTLLALWWNHLSSINISGLTFLEILWLNDNNFTTINLSNLPSLTYLNIANNWLMDFNSSGINNLITLNAYDDNLTTLDLSGLINLTTLNIYNNHLTGLDLSWLTNLTTLNAYNNNLMGSLDMFCPLTGLTTLNIENNHFTWNIPLCLEWLTSVTGRIYYNYLNRDAANFGLLSFLDTHFFGWQSQYEDADLGLTATTITSWYSFTITLWYHNYWPQKTLSGGLLYYDMIDGVNTTTNTTFSTWMIEKQYSWLNDPCFNDLYTNDTWRYLDLFTTYYQDAYHMSFLSGLESDFGYTWTVVGAGKFLIDQLTLRNEWPIDNWMTMFHDRFGIDTSSIVSTCGFWWHGIYIFSISNLLPWSGWTIIFTWTYASWFSTTGEIISHSFHFFSPYSLRLDNNSGNNFLTVNIPVYIPFEQISTSSNGGWSTSLSKDICPSGDLSSSYYDKSCGATTPQNHWVSPTCSIVNSPYSTEINDAYLRACNLWILTETTIQDSHLDELIQRKTLANMLSIFAIKVMWKTPNTAKQCLFADVWTENKVTKIAIKTACQLGLMWYHGNGITQKDIFIPNDVVHRAEFWTTLSRLLRGTWYANTTPFYSKHLAALKRQNIMTQISNPSVQEKKSWILLMIYRVALYLKK